MSNVRQIIDEIDGLAPIPQIARKVLSIVEDPLSSADDLAKVITYDQALTANLLRICNSPYFGLPRKIDSIHEAVTYLGMGKIVELAVAKIGWDGMKGAQEGYDLKEGELWRYSVASALLTRNMADRKNFQNKHLLFTASLLKDVGKVILHRYLGAFSEEINRLVQVEGRSFKEAEKLLFGIDHTEIGGLIAEKWRFSSRMIELIRDHHLDGDRSREDPEKAVLYLSDTLCMMMGIGVGYDGLAYTFQRRAVEILGFSEKDLQLVIASFVDRFNEVETLLQ